MEKKTKCRASDRAHGSRSIYSININCVYWSVWTALTKISRVSGLNERNIFLMVQEAGSLRSGC